MCVTVCRLRPVFRTSRACVLVRHVCPVQRMKTPASRDIDDRIQLTADKLEAETRLLSVRVRIALFWACYRRC